MSKMKQEYNKKTERCYRAMVMKPLLCQQWMYLTMVDYYEK
jgi:hypothetical protein